MPDLEKIRFLTVNYSRLQGLKAVPLGWLLFLTVLWANAQHGPARDLTLPLLMLLGGILLYAAIDRYYGNTYGRVEQAGHAYWFDFLLAGLFSLIAVGAFLLDTRSLTPVSVFGLVFAAALLLDYFRMMKLAGAKTAAAFPAGLACTAGMALAALLPSLGEDIFREIGIRSPILMVYAVSGILVVAYGLAGHLYLAQSMPREGDRKGSG
jgi:hypothetical protein